jgi:hypothetical protein
MTKRTRYFLMGSGAFLAAGLTVGLAAYYGGVRGFAAAAGPDELNYIPGDAVVVAYANVSQLMQSDFRQQVKSLEPGDADKGQTEFKNATGIDIERDIDYVVACMLPGATTTQPNEQPNGFVLAHGRFDQGRLEGLLRDKGAVEQTYKEHRLYVHVPPEVATDDGAPAKPRGEAMGVTFVNSEVAAIGTPSALKRLIDLQSGALSTVAGNHELMEMIRSVNSGNTWAVARFDVLRKRANLPAQVDQQIPPITWLKASGHVNGGVSGTVAVEARDADAANNLRQVISGLKGLAALQAGSKPEVTSMLQSIQIGGDGNTVSVSFAVPANAIDMLKGTVKGHATTH